MKREKEMKNKNVVRDMSAKTYRMNDDPDGDSYRSNQVKIENHVEGSLHVTGRKE
jgi:hypothetical protein